MKFLFDQSTDFRLIPHLTQLGHDVTAVSRNYPHGLVDEDVLTIAREEHRILVVADRDFGELIFNQRLTYAGGFPLADPRARTTGYDIMAGQARDSYFSVTKERRCTPDGERAESY